MECGGERSRVARGASRPDRLLRGASRWAVAGHAVVGFVCEILRERQLSEELRR